MNNSKPYYLFLSTPLEITVDKTTNSVTLKGEKIHHCDLEDFKKQIKELLEHWEKYKV